MAITKRIVKVVGKQNLATDYWLISFGFEEGFNFEAGQYLSIKVAEDGTRRSYSISSRPQSAMVEVMVDISPGGLGSKYIASLKAGDEVEVMGPMGLFSVNKIDPKPKKLFVATGSGITPLRSMIEDLLLDKNYQEKIKLVWGMRYAQDLFWQEEFNDLAQKFSNFSWEIVISKPDEHWHGKCGHVGNCLQESLGIDLGNLLEWETYLCGNQQMIIETGAWLLSKGMDKKDIHFEKFF